MPKEIKTGYASIDRPWLKYYEQGQRVTIAGKSVYEVLYERNHDHAEQVALEYFGRKITYQEVFQRVEKAKAAFERAGVQKGDRVAFLASSTPEIICGILALCRIGAVANIVNPLFEPDQIRARISKTGAKLIVVLDKLHNRLSEALKEAEGRLIDIPIIVVSATASMPWLVRRMAELKAEAVRSAKGILWEDFVGRTQGERSRRDAEYERDGAFIMVYSSGSTGASKGIVLTNDGICATISHYAGPNFSYERGDRFLQMIPIWFSTGIVLSVLMPLCLGVTVILEPVFSKESFARDIARYRPTMTLAATSLWLYAISGRELRHKDLSFLKYPITGGELILGRVESSVNHFLAAHNCKAPLIKGYGMCELGSTISSDDLRHQKPDAAGFPISGVTVAAFDLDTDREQPYGKPGELRVLSPSCMREYFNDPAATASFFWVDEQGRKWGRTGDMGFLDEEGFVHVLGRISDCFTGASGRKWYCFDIENVILKDPRVAQCEVVGVPRDGAEVPVAHLMLEKEVPADIQELLAALHGACVGALDAECIPVGYRICEAFPVKNNGKRDMEKLKEMTEGLLVPCRE